MSSRTIVIGGGAIGLSIAWELARRGETVTLCERDKQVGKATSWSASGTLPPAKLTTAVDPIDRLRGLSHELFPSWVDELMSVSGIDPGFRHCGAWYLAQTAGERASMVGMADYWSSLGIECESVTAGQLADREPAIQFDSGRAVDAWWVPDECQIRCPDYLRALHQACLVSGVQVIENAEVDDLRWNAQSTSVRLRDSWIEADRVVVCCGAWTGRIAPSLRLESSIVPVRGQILLLKTEKPLLRGIVNVGHRYVLCRDDGHTLVGSCEEEVGFDTGTTSEMLTSLHRFAIDLIPRFDGAPIAGSWSGLRPLTFDGFPMIGRVPETTNVFVASGHFRSGIHLSPATAVTLADLMMGDVSRVDLGAFRIGKQQSASPNVSHSIES